LQLQLPPTATLTLFGQTLLITVPTSDDANRERLLAEISPGNKQVFVSNEDFPAWLQLSCVARDAAAADEIVALVDEYLRTGGGLSLIPPWTTDVPMTDEHRRARRTYLAIFDSGAIYDDARLTAINEQVRRAMRSGDSSAIKKLNEQQAELIMELEAEHLARIEADPESDARVVALYRKMPRFPDLELEELEDVGVEDESGDNKELQAQYDAWSREMGALLGQLPMKGDRPSDPAALVSAQGGSVENLGPLVTFNFVTMRRIDRGAPALVDWLCSRGCSEVKYTISSAGLMFDE